jgi:hypothetical protein
MDRSAVFDFIVSVVMLVQLGLIIGWFWGMWEVWGPL